MKAILLIALFVVAIQARIQTSIFANKNFDISAHYNGFAEGMNLTEAQKDLATRCISDVTSDEKSAENLINDPTISPMNALEIYTLFDNIRNNLGTDCKGYFNELIAEIKRRNPAITQQSLGKTVLQNIKRHAPFVSQTVFGIIDSISEGKQFQAGVQEAHLVKILTGVYVPQPHATRDWNTLNFTEALTRVRNITQEATDVLTGYFNATGRTNQTTLARAIQCSITQSSIIESLKKLRRPQEDVLAQTQIIAELVSFGSRYLKDCNVQWEMMAPQLRKFANHPIHVIARTIHNIGLGAPEIIQLAKEIAYDSVKGDYYNAGRRMGVLENNLGQGI